jgi:predicted acetyltransferase
VTSCSIRPLAEGEQRAAYDLLSQALHSPRSTDEVWARRGPAFPAHRKFGAFGDGALIGSASSFGTELAVPGGKSLPAAAVDGVAVRADRTRRGVLTALMRAQLRDCADRGEAAAYLHASESTIYGRFGYGVAVRSKTVRVHRSAARFREDAPAGGQVRLLEPDEAHELLPGLYQRVAPYRPGMIDRVEQWWHWGRPRLVDENLVAVHTGADGDDGFVLYKPVKRDSFEQPEAGAALAVADLHAANVDALAGLWRYLLSVDLVGEIRAPNRPLDEPLGLMLTDPRSCEVVRLEDSTWLRVLDVATALAGRTYGQAEPVVLEVVDPLLQENTGRYRISPEGAERVEAPAGLRLGPEALGMLYLGDRGPGLLAALNRIEVLDPAAVPAADALFATTVAPYCGTPF